VPFSAVARLPVSSHGVGGAAAGRAFYRRSPQIALMAASAALWSAPGANAA
jgi:hypothetical protein